MDSHMMRPDLAAQPQDGATQMPAVGAQGGMPAPPTTPHGGYQVPVPAAAALQPSHHPSQHQHHHHHHYPPGSTSPPQYGGGSSSSHPGHHHNSPSASSSVSSATIASSSAAGGGPPAGRLGHVLHTMQQTGFHAWGFVIYRGCAYADEPLWQRYVRHMKQEVHSALAATPRLPGTGAGANATLDTSGRQLAPYLEWTVMEDPSLEGASTETVRRHFAAWAAARHPRRDGPGADGPFIESHVPRFMYCVYVDGRCLRTLAAFDDWLRLDRNGPMQYLACALIDKNCPEGGEGEPGLLPVDGCDRYYTGWMYAHVGALPELYNTLGHQRLISGPNNYARPPRIYPGHLYGASVPP
ncbi:hypothetical protein ISF_04371 [Cordyceps fumosorosea ARSEF 2679]|uniref:Uncharacterized protein n=1 Tax=Cordyceps fumosorosea (strain ARSEF 2679) TaxID=1081104 RepID=A0A167XGN5_CORFA|nr:hypothetical protein ISF_04371 [Cordyceps fumosorosea ARSEF 2679]OAA64961.1 hypothetical protein ISF_04371 [Cordyceps fumosorosea ARSEF 2679]